MSNSLIINFIPHNHLQRIKAKYDYFNMFSRFSGLRYKPTSQAGSLEKQRFTTSVTQIKDQEFKPKNAKLEAWRF
jgi:hypothetical protein